jgi:hypothetical protein
VSHSPDPSPAAPATSTNQFQIFEVWKEYEKIAMHFNDLLLRIRTGGLAAVTAVAGIASVVLKGDVQPQFRWETLTAVLIVLSLLWIALWVLDYRYYNRLLLGAVDALLHLETQSATGNESVSLDLSTLIEKAVKGEVAQSGSQIATRAGTSFFYGIVLTILVVGSAISTAFLVGYWGGPSNTVVLDCSSGDIRHILRIDRATQAAEDLSSDPSDPPRRGSVLLSDTGYLLRFKAPGEFSLLFRINRFTGGGTRQLLNREGTSLEGHGGFNQIVCIPYKDRSL